MNVYIFEIYLSHFYIFFQNFYQLLLFSMIQKFNFTLQKAPHQQFIPIYQNI